jgi:hypothetical protein
MRIQRDLLFNRGPFLRRRETQLKWEEEEWTRNKLVPPSPGCDDFDEVHKPRAAKRGRSTSPVWQPKWTKLEIKKGIDHSPVFPASTRRNTSDPGYTLLHTSFIPMQAPLPEIITEGEQIHVFPARTPRNTPGPGY